MGYKIILNDVIGGKRYIEAVMGMRLKGYTIDNNSLYNNNSMGNGTTYEATKMMNIN